MEININILENTNCELKTIKRELKKQRIEVKKIIRELEDFPQREEYILRLKTIDGQLEEELNMVMLSIAAINRIKEVVVMTENQIIDHFENDVDKNSFDETFRMVHILDEHIIKMLKEKNINFQ